MRRLAVVVVVLAAFAPGVGAASATRVIYGPPGTPPGWEVPLHVSGVLSVDFHGDPGRLREARRG